MRHMSKRQEIIKQKEINGGEDNSNSPAQKTIADTDSKIHICN